MKTGWILPTALCLLFCLSACGGGVRPAQPQTGQSGSVASLLAESDAADKDNNQTEANAAVKMTVQIGEKHFSATLEDNAAARELAERMRRAPVSIPMRDYSGFEKVGALGESLPANDRQMRTAPGDIVLYQGDQIVLFYGSNSWSYTKIGRVDDLTGWKDALGDGDVTVIFTLAE